MVKDYPIMWSIEPESNFFNNHKLFRGVNQNLWRNWKNPIKIGPNIFSRNDFKPDGLSTDWSKYCTPQDFLNRLNPTKNALDTYGVIEIDIGKFRKCIQENHFPVHLEHNPIIIPPINRGHTLITGFSDVNYAEIRSLMCDEYNTVQWARGYEPNFKTFN